VSVNQQIVNPQNAQVVGENSSIGNIEQAIRDNAAALEQTRRVTADREQSARVESSRLEESKKSEHGHSSSGSSPDGKNRFNVALDMATHGLGTPSLEYCKMAGDIIADQSLKNDMPVGENARDMFEPRASTGGKKGSLVVETERVFGLTERSNVMAGFAEQAGSTRTWGGVANSTMQLASVTRDVQYCLTRNNEAHLQLGNAVHAREQALSQQRAPGMGMGGSGTHSRMALQHEGMRNGPRINSAELLSEGTSGDGTSSWPTT
jgi:hypothetical protein